jgi:hypothetical protein
MVGERLLQCIQLAFLRESLDRLDGGAVGLDREHHAALEQHAVDDDGAGATVACVAAHVAARQVEVVAEEMDQQLARLDVALVRLSVDGDLDVHQLFPRASATARTATTCARWRR